LAQRLAKEEIKAIYASDLKRALETAEILAEPHHLTVETLPGLREIDFGHWEGLTFAEISEKYKDLADKWYSAPAEVQIPGGETFFQLKERIYTTILELVEKHDQETIVVVTHAGPIRALVCALLNIDLNYAFRIRQDNCALNIIEFYEGIGILCLLNDTSHLGEA
jgi:alpha-ribazole phosphatase